MNDLKFEGLTSLPAVLISSVGIENLGTIPVDQTAVLSAFADQVITDVEDQAATGTPLVATTVCVGTVIAFQSIEF